LGLHLGAGNEIAADGQDVEMNVPAGRTEGEIESIARSATLPDRGATKAAEGLEDRLEGRGQPTEGDGAARESQAAGDAIFGKEPVGQPPPGLSSAPVVEAEGFERDLP